MLWHHMCITWSSENGSWIFYLNGVKRLNGSRLAAGYFTVPGYVTIGELNGTMTGFNMWDEYFDDQTFIEKLAHACSSLTGNIVPWPEVQIWRKGNVTKMVSTLCQFSGKQTIKMIACC